MRPELLIPEPHKAIIKRKKNREKTLKIKNNTWRKTNSVNIAENMERESGQRTDTEDSSQVQIPV